MPDDWADRHVSRWRDHWLGLEFDDDTEAIVVRMGRLMKHFRAMTAAALAEVGLQDHEYETLHLLMIRETPGHASPSDLAADLGISNAGMSGRLESMERRGWVRRTVSPCDRRRVDIEVTPAGETIWRQAMDLRGSEEDRVVGALPEADRARLAALLKVLTLTVEGQPDDPADEPSG
jgi:DNA-binding MarR family transcriptional regulator